MLESRPVEGESFRKRRARPLDRSGEWFREDYDSICKTARRALHSVGGDESLSTVALAHETFLHLKRKRASSTLWRQASRDSLLSRLFLEMRTILRDRRRKRSAQKRGAGRKRISLSEWMHESGVESADPALRQSVVDALDDMQRRNSLWLDLVVRVHLWEQSVQEVSRSLGMKERRARAELLRAESWLRSNLRSVRK